MENLKFSDFAPLVNSRFRIHLDSSKYFDLELIEANDLSHPGQEQFSLIFRGPLNGPTAQQVFDIEHDSLGKLNLFLVPISIEKDGVRYEAIFNRFV
jgi:hypothetical protein